MIISSKVNKFDRDYKTNFERIHHMDEEEMLNLLMDFATIGVPEEKKTDEFKAEIEKTIKDYLQQKPKSKLDQLKDAVKQAEESNLYNDGYRILTENAVQLLVECAKDKIEQLESF